MLIALSIVGVLAYSFIAYMTFMITRTFYWSASDDLDTGCFAILWPVSVPIWTVVKTITIIMGPFHRGLKRRLAPFSVRNG